MIQPDFVLWEQYQKKRDPVVREKLILQYLYLVKYVVERMAMTLPSYVDTDDLYGCGTFGLIDAIEKYNLESGVKFETYAPIRIRGAILDALRTQDWVPRSVRQQVRQLEKTYHNLELQLGRTALDSEVCDALGINPAELGQLLNKLSTATFLSLDETMESDESNHATSVLTAIADEHSPDPVNEAEMRELKETLAKAIDGLPPQERLVISLYYYEELTLKEIGKVMKLSESRISQLHTKAVLRLRGKLSRYRQSLVGLQKGKSK